MSSLTPNELLSNERLVSETGFLINGILQLDIRDANIVMHQLSIIGSFSKIMKMFDNLIFPCLQKLLSFAVFTEDTESDCVSRGLPLADSTQSVRHKASSALLKMGTNLPDILINVQ